MIWRTLLAVSAMALASCGGNSSDEDEAVDSDSDGLTDAEEADLGLDANNDDTDGDGVLDGEEVELGLDGNAIDSDGDGYRDGDEIAEGSDPASETSKIYEGGWPYNAAKADIDESAVPDTIEVGELFMHFTAKDQFADTVDVWDYKNDEGKYIIVDISAQWCGPCNAMSAWLDGDLPDFDDYGWKGVREAVDSGDVYWITILGEDQRGNTARQFVTEQWFAEYPHPNIAILADTDYSSADFAQLQYWPTVIVLNPDLTVAWIDEDGAGWTGGLDFMAGRL
jgi:hypothetical protein